MNGFDVLLTALLGLYLFAGFKQGLARQLMGIIGFFLSLFLALYGSRLLAERLGAVLPLESLRPAQDVLERGLGLPPDWIATLAAGIFCFIGLFMILQLFFRFAEKELAFLDRIPLIGCTNMLLGGSLGLVKGLVFSIILISGLSLVPVVAVEQMLDGSALARLLGGCFPRVTAALKDYLFNYFIR